jgi:DNA-binding transcriptional ArsR family regulator
MAPTVKQLDGPALRALAHPLRMRIIAVLRREGPATATTLAERLGESSGATSYHLRSLARAGFVTEIPDRGTRRERWWQAAQEMTSWQPEHFLDDPEDRAAAQWFSGYLGRQAMEWIDDWIRQREHAEPAWIAAADQSDLLVHMTPDQVRAMLREVHEAIFRHRDDAAAANEGGSDGDVRPVRLLVYSLPDLGSAS